MSNVPLLGVVSRMDPQKGIDLIPKALTKLKDLPWQFVILGTGDPKLEESIRLLQTEFPDRVRAEFKYDCGTGAPNLCRRGHLSDAVAL